MSWNIVFLGLSISSSWGNGHATTYRGLTHALAERGHDVTFLERNTPWYREHRDLVRQPQVKVKFYDALQDLTRQFGSLLRNADVVVLGSYVPDGAILADWLTSEASGVTAFYDIDTPITLKGLKDGSIDYLSAAIIPRFDLYLSFTGGPVLSRIEEEFGSPRARALYCSADPKIHAPSHVERKWSLGYLGTFSADRQPSLERLLLQPARHLSDKRLVVAGAQYPEDVAWPDNVDRIEHLPPKDHAGFYCAQRFTLNLTRADMREVGFSPSVRLFEAAACAVPVISDPWRGLETIFTPGEEILVADTSEEVESLILSLPEDQRREIGRAARSRVLSSHTAQHRAREFETYVQEALAARRPSQLVEAVA